MHRERKVPKRYEPYQLAKERHVHFEDPADYLESKEIEIGSGHNSPSSNQIPYYITSEDIGAMFILTITAPRFCDPNYKVCGNCGTNDSPQWRKGWEYTTRNLKSEKQELFFVPLCNACGLKISKRYCSKCLVIYSKGDLERGLESDWITCTRCLGTDHMNCCGPELESENYVCQKCKS